MPTFRFGQSAMFEMDAQWRIESVERALEHLQEFLPHAKNQAFLRKKRELASCTDRLDKEAIEAELDLMELEWTGRFPAYFYGSMLVLLWSEIDAIIERFALEVRSTKSISLAFCDISGASTYSRLRKYAEAVLGVVLPENSAIEDLQFLRNLYAHHGGDVSSQSEGRKKRIDAIIKTHPGISVSDTFLVVDAAYLQTAAGKALELIKALRAVHPSTEPGLVEVDTHER